MAKRRLFFAWPVLLIVACTSSQTPTAPTSAPRPGPIRTMTNIYFFIAGLRQE